MCGYAFFPQLLVTVALLLQTAHSLPDFSLYPNHITFTQFLVDGTAGSYDFYWRIDQNQNNASLSMALHLYPVPMPNQTHQVWMGIGFGKAMFEAAFIIMHSGFGSTVPYIHEHHSNGRYSHLPKNLLYEYVTKLYKSEINQEGFYAEFGRLLAGGPNKALQPEISLSGPQDLLWAYNPINTIDFKGVFFQPHGPNTDNRKTHGLLKVDWVTGVNTVARVSDLTVRNIHGIGMLTIWFSVLPSGAYTARFLRSVPGWIVVHFVLQGLGILGFAIMLVLGIVNVRIWNRPHYILGLTIVGLVLVQAILGISNRAKLSNSETGPSRNIVRWIHRLNALVLLSASIAQAYIGLNAVYPIEDPANFGIWIAILIVFSILVLTFVCSEIYFRLRFRYPDRFIAKKLDAKNAKDIKDTSRASAEEESRRMLLVGKKEVNPGPGGQLLMKNAEEKEEAEIKQFTWNEFHDAVKQGKIYVIGNGRYVYDASRWITSHPGGQQILHNVAGTDISNDFFDELGTELLADSRSPLLFNPRASFLLPQRASLPPPPEALVSPMPDFGNFTESDWKFVLNSRRAHKHSLLAIYRLSNLLVGVVPSNENQNVYKRYTLTKKEGSRLRFAELYPTQEIGIVTRQSVEFQVRIKGKWYEQAYTPVSGSMTCFEVIVDDGDVGTFLKDLKPGEKQVKVRELIINRFPSVNM